MKAVVYKGYAARMEFDAEDEVFTGRIAGISDVVGFHGESVPGLIAAFHEAVEAAKSDQPSGTIIAVVRPGYTLNDQLVRPAQVRVAQ